LKEQSWRIIVGDCREALRALPDESVHCVVTSPPYFGLRDYGTGSWEGGDPDCDHIKGEMRRGLGLAESPVSTRGGGHKVAEIEDVAYGELCGKCGAVRADEQIGLEGSPREYVAELVAVFREVRRVLRDDGTVWLNIGDSYNAGRDGGHAGGSKQAGLPRHDGIERSGANVPGLKPKDLIGIPWRVAFALQEDGWYLRSEVIWAKPNPMPESVRDRPTKAHEQVFLLAKSGCYFYDRDAIREPHKPVSVKRVQRTWHNEGHKWEDGPGRHDLANSAEKALPPGGRNKRSVWEIATVPYKDAHFATFPPKLVEPCLRAGTPEGGVCVVCGTPWVRMVARERTVDSEPVEGGWAQDDAGRIGAQGVGHWRYETKVETLGWRPGCSCGSGGLKPDDLDLIESPTGEGGTDDPSLDVGRAGFSRPRGAGAGRSTITRFQQRGYARQLRLLSADEALALRERFELSYEAWAHYLRLDAGGGRPLPQRVLATLIEEGRLEPVDPPDWVPAPTMPAVVLDPFAGAGTTGLVALRLGRSFVGVELNPEYAEQARKRLRDDAPLMNVPAEAPESDGAPA
jgi:DNA modification methylase